MHSSNNIIPGKEVGLFLSRLFRQFWRKFMTYENDLMITCSYKLFQHLQERQDLSELVLVFSLEGALLRSSSSSSSASGFFPYFMLVAFEGGSIIRAFILFAFYPIILVLDAHHLSDMGLRIMVMICFFGLRQDRFSAIGRAVLPKFLLEDVGLESFKVLRRGGKKIGVTNLPLIMVESFLREYMEVDFVVGRELKVFRGYFLGILTENKQRLIVNNEHGYNMVGITSSYNGSPHRHHHHHHHLFSLCKQEIYMVREEERRQWKPASRDMYPRPLIFHDGRLAFRPAFVWMVVTFMWFPVGLFLSIVRISLVFLPYRIASPISAFTGIRLRVTKPKSRSAEGKEGLRRLYVCNHRTLLDPVMLSIVLRTPLWAVTYSISRISEFLSPIKTVRLRRNREEDTKIMENILLSKAEDLVVCPEGTTCREPYLLRFSPLFAELTGSNNNIIIIPVAVDTCVSMFHGTTAGGLKFLDPFFFLMNPNPGYAFELLDTATVGRTPDDGLRSRVEVANVVQRDIGKALGFECTMFTRKDKYLLLTSRG